MFSVRPFVNSSWFFVFHLKFHFHDINFYGLYKNNEMKYQSTSKNLKLQDASFKYTRNKYAFQQDAHRPLVDRIWGGGYWGGLPT